MSGYGAEAINPYLGYATISNVIKERDIKISEKEAYEKYTKSICKGILKVMSKMGISTIQSYCGAQIFDAVGLSNKVVDKYFTGTSNKVNGISINEIVWIFFCKLSASPVHIDGKESGTSVHSMRDIGQHSYFCV